MSDNQLLELVVGEIKELSKEQKEMGKTLAVQESNLREHMRRTELAEKSIDLLSASLVPVQKHVNAVGVVLKICGAVTATAAFVLLVLQLVSTLKSLSL